MVWQLIPPTYSHTAPDDYIETTLTAVFSPGSPSESCFLIAIVDDNVFESQEIFSVTLENLVDTIPTPPTTATILIMDDDSKLVEFFVTLVSRCNEHSLSTQSWTWALVMSTSWQ